MIPIHKITGRLGNQMFLWAYVYAQFKEGKVPDTYVQDYRYFDKYKEDLKKIYGQGLGEIPYVGVHVRRGDYVNNPFHNDLMETDYYSKAMSLFPEKRFMVVTDDREYCREKFPNCEIYEGRDEIEDFNALGSCTEGIITVNSSFSFWAAYISNTEKIIAPKEDRWFRDGIIRSHIPDNWIKI